MAGKAVQDLEAKFQDGDRMRARVRQLVLNSDTQQLSEIFNADNIDDLVIEQAWDLIPTLCEGLTDLNEEERTDLVDVCFSAIKLLAEKGNAKEVVLALLEQADTFLPDFKWQGLLEPIQIALLRLPSKRQFSLKTTLETLLAHIETTEIPEYNEADSEEKRLLSVDREVNRLLENLRLYVDFMAPFVKELPKDVALNNDQIQQRDYLLICIFQILSKKLLFLYHDPVDDAKSAVWFISEKLMSYVAYMCRDLYKASEFILDLMLRAEEKDDKAKTKPETEDSSPVSDSESSNSLPHVSVAVFHYLLFVEGMSLDLVPCILTRNHTFELCLPSIALMLSSPRPVIVDKGVKLALKLLDYKTVETFPVEFTELKQFTAFMDNLLQAVVMCQSKAVRSQCVKIFPAILQKFDSRGKHIFFIYSFKHTGHSGVKGYLLQLVKDEIVKSFQNDNDYLNISRVKQIIDLLFVLPEGAMSDLLDLSDVIIACLNFLRYLVIRDQENQSGIWNEISRLESEYFEPLTQALMYSSGHYEQELKSCREGKSATEDLLRTGIDYKVKVGKQELPVDIPPKQALSILESALHNFDLIKCLLGRLEELIRINKPKPKA